MDRIFFGIGALYGFLGVALGAFGAHALKQTLSPEMLAVFEVGVRYQMYHACALPALAWASTRWPGKAMTLGGWLIVIGVLVFSGSLYALSLSGVRAIGAITPFGGAALLAGWVCVAWAVVRWHKGRMS